MRVCDFNEEPSSVFNDSSSDTQEMRSQGFEASRPPGLGQGFSLHDGQDVISQNIESPPGRIGIEPFVRQHSNGEVILRTS